MEFNKAYSRSEFIKFLKGFLPDDTILNRPEKVPFFTKMQYASSAEKLGDCDSLDLKIFEVRHKSKNDARVGLSKDVFRMMAEEGASRALVIFVPEDSNTNYRFSFIELTLEWGEGSKIKKTYSNPRRYSYYLGEGIAYYTPNKFLNEKGRVISIEDLRSRFSVEVLTKTFYTELAIWYAWALTLIQFPNDIKEENKRKQYIAENTIRLVTRLIFVWFLKQKHLVPDGFFDVDFIADNLLKDFNPNKKENLFGLKSLESKYYKAILQNLFFAILNCPITQPGKSSPTERRFSKNSGSDHDNKKLMRYKDLFKDPQLFVDMANKTVPFLNGGLFDCLYEKKNDKYVYIDVFTDRKEINKQLIVPDFLFFGDKAGKNLDLSGYFGDTDKKNVSSLGIIDILKKYNFTVEENTPFDQEVSLDPELLGKVFENLLASYNPETQTTARKKTGSFYTPREIVQYMVDESLISHLNRTVDASLESKFRALLQYNDIDIDFKEDGKDKIIKSLYECKVIDPACGSGAFPVGMLQQMVHILSRLDPDNSKWKEIVKAEALKETNSAYDVESKEERDDYLREIERSFDDRIANPDYARKLYLIENCIFGVDIQPIAIQISKLRFFISLIVDQITNNNPADNFGIRPLPNLEANFVAANSLIPLSFEEDNKNLGYTKEVENLKEEMKEANHKIFNAKTFKTKNKWRTKFDETKEKLKEELKKNGFLTNEGINQIESWNPFDQNGVASFFDPEWMFGIKNKFDIVIANPPYVSTKGVSEDEKKEYEKIFGFSDDLYNLFTFKGLDLSVENGSVTYITPKTFWTTQTKQNMRDLMLSNILRYVFDTANPFEAVMVDTCIWQVIKHQYNKEVDNYVQFKDGSENLSSPIVFDPILQSSFVNNLHSVIFKPTDLNLKIIGKYGDTVKVLHKKWWDKIKNAKNIAINRKELERYRNNLKVGELALLGCLTEGAQGLATGNNGRYIAVRSSTKWAENIRKSRPKKLSAIIEKYTPLIPGLSSNKSVKDFLCELREDDIAILFDRLKERFGRDIFGKGYLYRIIDDDQLAQVSELSEEEKKNGIDPSKNYYIPYDKGDKDGNRWYLETPFAIAWTKDNVTTLKTDPKARYQGHKFYFREGFCWIDVNSTYLKARLKGKGIFDVLSMSLFTQSPIPDSFFVILINSEFISFYVDNFLNNTSHFQINDARQLPIIVPNQIQIDKANEIVERAVKMKKSGCGEDEFKKLQEEVDDFVLGLYGLK